MKEKEIHDRNNNVNKSRSKPNPTVCKESARLTRASYSRQSEGNLSLTGSVRSKQNLAQPGVEGGKDNRTMSQHSIGETTTANSSYPPPIKSASSRNQTVRVPRNAAMLPSIASSMAKASAAARKAEKLSQRADQPKNTVSPRVAASPETSYDPRKRERNGNWEMIFPFNSKTATVS